MSDNLPDFRSFGFDGRAALAQIVESSSYSSVEQAVASLAVFAHPETVAQTGGRNIFSVIRCRNRDERGTFMELGEGNRVMLDDNKAPTDASIWAHGIARRKFKDVQFNHLWAGSKDVCLYTSLANICMLPAFLSKLSDTDEGVRSALRFRAFELFGDFLLESQGRDPKPAKYNELRWAETLPPVRNLELAYRDAMRRKASDRTTRCARELGWVFSGFRPDPSV